MHLLLTRSRTSIGTPHDTPDYGDNLAYLKLFDDPKRTLISVTMPLLFNVNDLNFAFHTIPPARLCMLLLFLF